MLRAQVLEIIYEAIRRTNELRGPDDQLSSQEDTALYGREGSLDSLGLVSFILDVEETISLQLGIQLVLADDKAMSQRRNPFRDVAALADYITARLQESQPCTTAP